MLLRFLPAKGRERVDAYCEKADTTRSAFARQALAAELKRQEIKELEEQHRRGYELVPDTEDDLLLPGQVWPKWED